MYKDVVLKKKRGWLLKHTKPVDMKNLLDFSSSSSSEFHSI